MIQREVIIIFGRTGEGKSTLAKKIIARYNRVVVFDTLHEYHGTVFSDFDSFVDYFQHPDSDFFLVCRFPSPVSFSYAARLLFETQEDILIVLEEADNYLNSVSFNDAYDPFFQIVTRGRHAKISILAITQRPTLIAITLRAMSTRVITFCQTEPGDLDRMEDWGFDPEEVRNLEKFKYLEKTKGGIHDSNDKASPSQHETPKKDILL
jgi:hypothetical protein